jgi:beta-galactosidase
MEPKKAIDIPNTTAMTGSNVYFCANGIIGADRNPHPQIAEVKKVYQEIKVEAFDIPAGKFRVKNKFLFTDISSYKCKWVLKAEGEVVEFGELDKFECEPLSETFITIPYSYDNIPKDKEVVLTISFFTKKKTLGLKSNFEIAWDQFIINEMPQPVKPENDGDLTFTVSGKKVTVENDKVKVVVDNGKIVSYVIDSNEMLLAPMMPNYFRALTDNDIDFLNFTPMWTKFHPYYKWQRATKHTNAVKTVAKAGDDNTVEIHIAFSTAGLKNSVATYKIYPDGKIYVYHSATPTSNMVRFGYQMTLSKDMEYVKWYGRGPVPTYCDRKTGAKIDKYSSTVTDLEYRYMRPQESSNRTDMRYMTITNKKGKGLKFTAYFNDPLNFSAYHYTTDGLEKATHINDIPYEDITTVNIDHMLCGVGGDLPGQAFVREPYIMKKGEKQAYSFIMEPVR